MTYRAPHSVAVTGNIHPFGCFFKKIGVRLAAVKKKKASPSPTSRRLRAIIERRADTIRAFADELKIPYPTLQNYLLRSRPPHAEHLAKLALAGIDLNWLLTGRQSQVPILAAAGIRELRGWEPTEEEALLYADSGLLNMLWQKALELADEFHLRHLDRGEKPLALIDLLTVAGHYYLLMIKVVAGTRERMTELLEAGVKPLEYIAIVAESLGPRHDEKVAAILRK
jgi:hypothetical protein